MRAKGHSILVQLAQFAQAEDLESSGIGKDRAPPRHETVQTAHFADGFDARAQVQVIGVSENDVCAKFFENVLRHSLDGGDGSYWHKDRSLNFGMWRNETCAAGAASDVFDSKVDGHGRAILTCRRRRRGRGLRRHLEYFDVTIENVRLNGGELRLRAQGFS